MENKPFVIKVNNLISDCEKELMKVLMKLLFKMKY